MVEEKAQPEEEQGEDYTGIDRPDQGLKSGILEVSRAETVHVNADVEVRSTYSCLFDAVPVLSFPKDCPCSFLVTFNEEC